MRLSKSEKLAPGLSAAAICNQTDPDGRTHWHVTLSYLGREMTVPDYKQGSACDPDGPTADDVFYCLAMDVIGCEEGGSFEEWAAAYGEDPDSRAAERTYLACMEEERQLRLLLGSDFEALVRSDALSDF